MSIVEFLVGLLLTFGVGAGLGLINIGCAAAAAFVVFAMWLSSNGDAGVLPLLWVPAMVAGGVIARRLQKQQDDAARSLKKDAVASSRSVIDTDYTPLGSAIYLGGSTELRPQRIDILSDKSNVWIAPNSTGDRPLRIPLNEISGVTVGERQRVVSTTNVGASLMLGGATTSVGSVTSAYLHISWNQGKAAEYEIELLVNEGSSHANQLRASILDLMPHASISASNPVSSQGDATVPCPWCAESIKPAARICRFCNRSVAEGNPELA